MSADRQPAQEHADLIAALIESFPDAWKAKPGEWVRHLIACDVCGKYQTPRLLAALADALSAPPLSPLTEEP